MKIVLNYDIYVLHNKTLYENKIKIQKLINKFLKENLIAERSKQIGSKKLCCYKEITTYAVFLNNEWGLTDWN